MAWWTTENDELLSEASLAAVEQMLMQIRSQYMEDHDRFPTLAEVLKLVQIVLERRADEFTQDSEELIVAAIVAKTKKRPKKQPIKSGDVFSVPLAEGLYAFGRVTPQADFFIYFEVLSPVSLPVAEILESRTIRFPFLTDTTALEDWQWKIIGNVPWQPNKFELQQFRIANQVTCDNRMDKGFIRVSSKLRFAPEEAELLPPLAFLPAGRIEKLLLQRLRDADE